MAALYFYRKREVSVCPRGEVYMVDTLPPWQADRHPPAGRFFTPLADPPPSKVAADSTHPTGMNSCFLKSFDQLECHEEDYHLRLLEFTSFWSLNDNNSIGFIIDHRFKAYHVPQYPVSVQGSDGA